MRMRLGATLCDNHQPHLGTEDGNPKYVEKEQYPGALSTEAIFISTSPLHVTIGCSSPPGTALSLLRTDLEHQL
eukprot:756487-Hanusia_phi.AAC.5